MRVREFQDQMKRLYGAKDEARGLHGTTVWFVEEAGELARAIRRREGIGDELADVVAWAASIANLTGVDLEAALKAKYPGPCGRCGASPCACP